MPDGAAPSSPRTLWEIIKGGSHVRTSLDHTPIDEAPARRLVRDDEGRWLGGVASGLGRYFDVNPLVYRIAFAALALAGGTGLLLYLAAYLVIPGEHDEESIAVEALRNHRERPVVLRRPRRCSPSAPSSRSRRRASGPSTGNVWLAATLVGGALVWWHVSQRADRPRAAAEPATPRLLRRHDAADARRSAKDDEGSATAVPASRAAGEAFALRARPRRAPRGRGSVRAARRARRLRHRRRGRARGRAW